MNRTALACALAASLISGSANAFTPPTWRKPTIGSPYGINVHDLIWNAPNPETQALTDAAMPWVRVDFNWLQIEPDRGVFDWTVTDGVVNAATANGLNVYATLAYTPGWATDTSPQFGPPRDPADWDTFVFAIVSRYKDRIHAWGMWNEPNVNSFWSGTRQQYIDLILKVGSDAAKRADPGCVVGGPDLANLETRQWDTWLRDVLMQAGDKLDVVTHHRYGDTASSVLGALDGPQWPWDPPAVRDVIVDAGAGAKPFWLTEVGWHTDDVSESDQAADYTGVLDGMLTRPWWKRVFFYELQDDPMIAHAYGVLRADHSPKPAYDAFRRHIAGHTPVPVAQQLGAAYAGRPVSFDASGSQDPSGPIATFSWDFDESDGVGVDATGASATHTYTATGAFSAVLTVVGHSGVEIFARFEVSVAPAPPPPEEPDAGAADSSAIEDAGGSSISDGLAGAPGDGSAIDQGASAGDSGGGSLDDAGTAADADHADTARAEDAPRLDAGASSPAPAAPGEERCSCRTPRSPARAKSSNLEITALALLVLRRRSRRGRCQRNPEISASISRLRSCFGCAASQARASVSNASKDSDA
jgi:polysaccharide biosynthesis protein PslG